MNSQPAHTNLTDADLVIAYKKTREQQYLLALYQRYAGLLYGVCLKYLKEPDNARDATTDIYEELVKKLLQHDIDNFKPWLYTLAKNHCLQKLRSGKKMPVSEFPESFMYSEAESHLDEVLLKESKLEGLEDCIKQLSEEQKTMVDLFYLQEKCYNDIVMMTGLSWNTVRSHIQNGRRNLKNCMEQKQRE